MHCCVQTENEYFSIIGDTSVELSFCGQHCNRLKVE